MATVWLDSPAPRPGSPRALRPRAQQSIRILLGEAGIARMIEDYRNGAEAKELASCYGFGLTTVKRVLREEGARKRRPRTR
ncbi:hypothetical protein WIS52_14855 [Pseudonocardia nematodicida]|uniref:Uncharacterized protein n=2 Tax=Pseudonocardia nematodicida TaxID=1206997 RepID=A0ABV1KC78_9PSEU